jgi:hypothetical protein
MSRYVFFFVLSFVIHPFCEAILVHFDYSMVDKPWPGRNSGDGISLVIIKNLETFQETKIKGDFLVEYKKWGEVKRFKRLDGFSIPDGWNKVSLEFRPNFSTRTDVYFVDQNDWNYDGKGDKKKSLILDFGRSSSHQDSYNLKVFWKVKGNSCHFTLDYTSCHEIVRPGYSLDSGSIWDH